MLNVHRKHKAYQRRGEAGGGGGGGGGGIEMGEEGDYIPIRICCHHQNVSCIKIGSDESHFSVAVIVRDKVTRQCPQTTTFEEKEEQKRIRTEVPLLSSQAPYR